METNISKARQDLNTLVQKEVSKIFEAGQECSRIRRDFGEDSKQYENSVTNYKNQCDSCSGMIKGAYDKYHRNFTQDKSTATIVEKLLNYLSRAVSNLTRIIEGREKTGYVINETLQEVKKITNDINYHFDPSQLSVKDKIEMFDALGTGNMGESNPINKTEKSSQKIVDHEKLEKKVDQLQKKDSRLEKLAEVIKEEPKSAKELRDTGVKLPDDNRQDRGNKSDFLKELKEKANQMNNKDGNNHSR